MRIYRIENSAGVGPYRGGVDVSETPLILSHRPVPLLDRILGPAWDEMDDQSRASYYFGFVSLLQLRRWFNDDSDLIKMSASGFSIAVYEVPPADVIAGQTQAAFAQARAFRLASRGLYLQ